MALSRRARQYATSVGAVLVVGVVVAALRALPGVDATAVSQAGADLRGVDRQPVGAGRLLRHRQPDLERAVLPAGDPGSAARGVRGGAYIGVGPDQNFSYIGEVRPSIAFIIDVRRDNLLLHLLFKALFELSATRIEYLAHLTGRPLPPAVERLAQAPIDRLIAYFEQDARQPRGGRRAQRRGSTRRSAAPACRSRAEDLATIAGFHRRFMEDGLSLRFNSAGRPPQAYYPTYRDLLLETDAARQPDQLPRLGGDLPVREVDAGAAIASSRWSATSAVHRRCRRSAARSPRAASGCRRSTSRTSSSICSARARSRASSPTCAASRGASSAVLIRSVFGRYPTFGRPGDASQSQLHGARRPDRRLRRRAVSIVRGARGAVSKSLIPAPSAAAPRDPQSRARRLGSLESRRSEC